MHRSALKKGQPPQEAGLMNYCESSREAMLDYPDAARRCRVLKADC